ncbi:hypothetical protein GCM10009127_25900 [Alteraurantiacibacter aestuarii]|uniref:lasso peptide biosynthesis B2 protein n=1 Tax=Alteraurantiacibacter aestuarii TaxID=650004 RepID=UPI0031D7E42E
MPQTKQTPTPPVDPVTATGPRPSGPALVRKLGTFASLPPLAIAWLFPSFCMLAFAATRIASKPFRDIAPALGENAGAISCSTSIGPQAERRARALGLSIRTVAKYLPWRSDCFAQALTAQWSCRIFGIASALHFGVAEDEAEGMKAHAWVTAGSVWLTGGRESRKFTPLSCFVRHPRGHGD